MNKYEAEWQLVKNRMPHLDSLPPQFTSLFRQFYALGAVDTMVVVNKMAEETTFFNWRVLMKMAEPELEEFQKGAE